MKRSSVGCFWFWALALLALPVCSLPHGTTGPGPNLSRGPAPHPTAIFCDIERRPGPTGRPCATDTDRLTGIRLESAAVALVAGQTSNIGIDHSPAAFDRCGDAGERVDFQGPFPQGYSVCLNCGAVIGTPRFPDANAACVAQCEDFFGTTLSDGTIVPNNPPHSDDVTFCASHAKASTNFPLNACYTDACTNAGTLRPDFADPRRIPEPVIWQNQIGVFAVGGSLTRGAASTGTWDAGAASSQTIDSGDGYVEFTATETDKARVCGLSSGAPPDANSSFADIGFGIDLFSNGQITIFESGNSVATVGAYTGGEKFRVKVKDNLDPAHTATITYVRILGPCADGTRCAETPLYTSLTTAAYPFRVDSSLFDLDATLTEVRVVRIHQ